MKVLKPTTVCSLYNGSANWGIAPGTQLAVPITFVEDERGYFFQTYNRSENNCVHAKVVVPGRIPATITPFKLTKGNITYSSNGVSISRYAGSGNYAGQKVTITTDGLTYNIQVIMTRFRQGLGYRWKFNRVSSFNLLQHRRFKSNNRYWIPLYRMQDDVSAVFAEIRRRVQILSDAYEGIEAEDSNDAISQLVEGFAADLLPVVQMVSSSEELMNSFPTQVRVATMFDLTTEGAQYPKPSKEGFIFYEPHWIADGVDPLLFGRSTNNYWLGVMYQEVTQSALTNLPVANDNNLQNITAIVDAIRSIVFEHSIPLPKSWQDAWLQYRYVVKTTASDVKENVSFLKRNLSVLDTGLKTYGITTRTVEGVDVTMRCDIKMKRKELSLLKKMGDALYRYGLSPDLYIVWDSIPFSFIVDWFLPVGGLASAADRRKAFSRGNYEFLSIVYSLSYVKDGVRYYSRWTERDLKPLQSLYWFESDPSTKTVLCRAIDALALIIG